MAQCCSYLRVSGSGQLFGDGQERQRQSITKYAGAFGHEIVREYFDGGISGTMEAFDRPALTDLFALIRANGIRLVLIERADRLARDLMVSEIILQEFRKLRTKVIECEGGNDLSVEDNEPTKVLIRQILGAVSQFEKAIVVQKLRAARLRVRKEQGYCEGPRPFGLNSKFPGEAVVVERITQLRREGLGMSAIAVRLNQEGIPTRFNRRWHAMSVKRVVQRLMPVLAQP